MWVGIISLFPEMFQILTKYGIISKAIKKKIIEVHYFNPREFTNDKRKTVDDYPYGGGSGMLMMVAPLLKAIVKAKNQAGNSVKTIYLSPQGKVLNQEYIKKLSYNKKIILICGRYKGIDERLLEQYIDEEYSIGDYILSGGELAAMILIDSISRFIPGVLGNPLSIIEDSFYSGLLDCPHYTRPKLLLGMKVPAILLSGNHIKINEWRIKQSLGYT